ncbi:MAG: hypothetical protein ACXWKH_11140 [Limisphaerales bacterium]
MIFKSPLISLASGKLAGNVLTRGRGNSLVMRKLSIPTNPRSDSQNANRSFFAGLAATWATVLTSAQRIAWEGYASSVTLINKLGDPIHLSGISMYIRNNQARLSAGPSTDINLARIDDAPAIHTLGAPPDLSAADWKATTPFGTTGLVPIPEPGTSGQIGLKFSAPQNAGRKFFNGPFKTFGTIPFETTDMTVDIGETLANLEPVTGTLSEGQTLFVKAAFYLDDGRTSNPTTKAVVIGPVA